MSSEVVEEGLDEAERAPEADAPEGGLWWVAMVEAAPAEVSVWLLMCRANRDRLGKVFRQTEHPLELADVTWWLWNKKFEYDIAY